MYSINTCYALAEYHKEVRVQMKTPAYNDYLRSKIETTDKYDKDIITYDQWRRTMESILQALFNVHPQIAKREARALGLHNIEWEKE